MLSSRWGWGKRRLFARDAGNHYEDGAGKIEWQCGSTRFWTVTVPTATGRRNWRFGRDDGSGLAHRTVVYGCPRGIGSIEIPTAAIDGEWRW